MDRWEKAVCRGVQVYNVYVWMAAGAMCAQMHSELSIYDQTPLPPHPVAALLSSERRLGKVSHFLCRAIAPQLLVSAPLPSLFALLFPLFLWSSLDKLPTATHWRLWGTLCCSYSVSFITSLLDFVLLN